MDFQYINQYYKVPAEYGRRIEFEGKRKGIIVQCQGNYIGVNFDDRKPNQIDTLHPTDKVKYLEIGKVRKTTRSQQRYQDYMDADWFDGTFWEWICRTNKH